MQEFGYIRVACAVPTIQVGNCEYNKNAIIEVGEKALKEGVEILLFSELVISGYTCGDLFFQNKLQKETEKTVVELCRWSEKHSMLIAVGGAMSLNNGLYNVAFVIHCGRLLGIVPKTYLPNNNEYYEKRWFRSGDTHTNTMVHYAGQEVPFRKDVIFQHENLSECQVAIELCEDVWATIPPSSFHALAGATLILNLSASNEVVAKSDYRYELVRQQSARCVGGYAYATGGFGESTTDTVYGGHSMIAENGRVLAESSQYKLKEHYIVTDIDFQKILHERQQNASFGDSSICINHKEYKYIMFNTTSQSKDVVRKVDPHPFVPSKKKLRNHRCHEIFNIQSFALAKRINHIGQNNMIIGISGGLDSTLALLVTIKTCEMLGIPHTSVHAVTMPGFGTTDRTYHNAVSLIKELGCAFHEISIKKACLQHFEDIGHDPSVHDITFENVQARERTKILMNLANQYSGIVIGTGDLSELALGWATYNGDHMSMYGVNAGIPKTLVRYVVEWYAFTCGKSKYDACVDEEVARILLDILDTPVSPELLPPDEKGEIVQKTEETVGPYELHDFFLYNMVRFGYPPKKIFKLATMGFGNQYDEATIKKWLRTFYWRFFSQQFKRSCLPDGPKIGTISLSPRSDWRMPSDASVQIWMNEIDEIEVG